MTTKEMLESVLQRQREMHAQLAAIVDVLNKILPVMGQFSQDANGIRQEISTNYLGVEGHLKDLTAAIEKLCPPTT
jgi:hypothetical protein